MLKTFALIVRRPDVDRDAFRAHYEDVHSPLALPLLEGLYRYVKYHVVDELYGPPSFDVLSGFWYRSVEDAMATVARVDGPAGDAIRADELSFMDKPRNTFFAVAEGERPDGVDEGGDGSDHCFVLVEAPDAGREAYLAAFDARAWGDLAAAFGDPAFALPHRTLGGASSPCDRLLQLAAAPPRGDAVARWAAREEARGARVRAVHTRRFETETPWKAPS